MWNKKSTYQLWLEEEEERRRRNLLGWQTPPNNNPQPAGGLNGFANNAYLNADSRQGLGMSSYDELHANEILKRTGGNEGHFMNKNTKTWEDIRTYPYLDSADNRTIGWGTNINSRTKHDTVNWDDGKSSDEAWNDLKRLDEHKAGNHKAEHFEPYTNSRITPEEANRLYDMDHKIAAQDAKAVFKSYDNHHPNLKEILDDLSYNLGKTKLNKYENLKNHIENDDFHSAAQESHRNGIGNERNEWTKERFIMHGDILNQMKQEEIFYNQLIDKLGDFPDNEEWWEFLKRYYG